MTKNISNLHQPLNLDKALTGTPTWRVKVSIVSKANITHRLAPWSTNASSLIMTADALWQREGKNKTNPTKVNKKNAQTNNSVKRAIVVESMIFFSCEYTRANRFSIVWLIVIHGATPELGLAAAVNHSISKMIALSLSERTKCEMMRPARQQYRLSRQKRPASSDWPWWLRVSVCVMGCVCCAGCFCLWSFWWSRSVRYLMCVCFVCEREGCWLLTFGFVQANSGNFD